MDFPCGIYINNKNVTDRLQAYIKLFKIVKSEDRLVDKLYIVIEEHCYTHELPAGDFCLTLIFVKTKRIRDNNCIFYFNKEHIVKDTAQIKSLNEKEKAIVEEKNNIVLQGLSATFDQIEKLQTLHQNFISNEVMHKLVCTNTNLQNILTCICQEIFEKKKNPQNSASNLLIQHSLSNTDIEYYKPQEIIKLNNGRYTNHVLQDLAEIFYSVANIRNNKLYFMQKRYAPSHPYTYNNIRISSEQVISKEYIKGKYNQDNEIKYKGVKYNYWVNSTTNIKNSSIGSEPFLNLDRVYEESLAFHYINSRFKELEEKEILKLTLKDFYNQYPGYYLYIETSIAKQASFEGIEDIFGYWQVKECIIIYAKNEDPTQPGPSTKKTKLMPSWYTILHLIKVKQL